MIGMKKVSEKCRKRCLEGFALFALTAVLLLPAAAEAATEITAAATQKKAPRLKEKVTYVVTQKKTDGYLYFTPAQTGTYKIVISDYEVSDEDDDALGSLWVGDLLEMETNGGTSEHLSLATDGYADSETDVDSYLTSRYGKLKLKKGKKIYLNFFSTKVADFCTYQLKITCLSPAGPDASKEKAPALSGLSVNSSKSLLKLSWKKNSKLTGYQAQIATNKKFKNASSKTTKKTSIQFTYKSGKKYYFRVRGYISSSGQKSYTKWSKVQSKIVN